MKEQISNYLRAGYSGLYVITQEEERVEADLREVTAKIGTRLFAWSASEGIVDVNDGTGMRGMDPFEALDVISELPENSTVLLRDFHPFLDDPNPMLHRKMKELLRHGKGRGTALVLTGCRLCLPPELERDITVVEYPLPSREELEIVLVNLGGELGVEPPRNDSRERILEATAGMTTIEAENAYALSIIEANAFCPDIISREKAGAIRKDGLLEMVETTQGLEAVGGLDNLKNWLVCRQDAFGTEARQYGLPLPRGVMIIGIPGTGKSLTAKAAASVLHRPLLRMDAGRLFAGLVGESEANLRKALRVAEAIAPCVLWLDEIEKAFGSTNGATEQDGGTSSRVFGAFLTWMQERKAAVFVTATANDVRRLPPELMRKGRFDEIFFVDLPDKKEREAIWKIQIAKYGRRADSIDIPRLAEQSKGYTGSEIEQVIIDALYFTFKLDREPDTDDLVKTLAETVPFSRLMGEQVAELRRWAQGRTRPASKTNWKQDLYRVVKTNGKEE